MPSPTQQILDGINGIVYPIDPLNASPASYIWGVHYLGGSVFASDMLGGLWRLQAFGR